MTSFPLHAAVYGIACLWLATVIPAGVVCALKQRWAFFFVGWLCLGLTWYVGALEKTDGRPWSQRAALAWAGGAIAAIVVLGGFAARPSPVLGVDGRTLEFSVDGSIVLDFSEGGSCSPVDGNTWSCPVYSSEFSGTVPYEVTVGRFGCWTARSDSPGEREDFSGCLTLFDYVFE